MNAMKTREKTPKKRKGRSITEKITCIKSEISKMNLKIIIKCEERIKKIMLKRVSSIEKNL